VKDSLGRARLVQLTNAQGDAITRQYVSGGTATGPLSIFNRTVLHLSIGQAY